MQVSKHLSFNSLIDDFGFQIDKIADHRRIVSNEYSIRDIMPTSLSCMYLQSGSLLSFQRRHERRAQRNNLRSVFGVENIPSDNALKEFIDKVSPNDLAPLFKQYISKLQRANILKDYRFINDKYLVALDGTQYFSSKKISCDCCLKQEHKNGSITYSHKVVQASIVSPDKKAILPLAPEDISNNDGKTKQDCETNASKRLLKNIQKSHPKLPLILLADSLYANAPFINWILS